MQYSKMMPPHNRSIIELAREVGISEATLYIWRRQACERGLLLGSIRGHAVLSTGAGQEPARDPRVSLACCNGKLRHLGVGRAPKKSTLSYANANRPWQLFQDLFYATLDHVRQGAPKHRFRFKNKLLSLDGGTISLCLNLFPWAKFLAHQGSCQVAYVAGSRWLPA